MRKQVIFLTITLIISSHSMVSAQAKDGTKRNQKKQLKIVFQQPLNLTEQLRNDLQKTSIATSMQVAILRPDTTITWNFGAATGNTMFRVGSISKTFAGLAMLKLVEQGKVSLDAKLTEIAPELKIKNPYEATHPVLLKHLLQASAGFVGFNQADYRPDPTVTPIKKWVLENPYPFEVKWQPGVFSVYHNLGPTITAYLVEKLSGKLYDDFVAKHFFQPLQMNNSSFVLTEQVKTNLANYNEKTYSHIGPRPSGALNTSVPEFLHLLQMFLNNGTYANNQILQPQTVNSFETSTSGLAARQLKINEGHGINNWTESYKGIVYNAHGGMIPPFYSAFYAFSRKHGTGFVIMCAGPKALSEEGYMNLGKLSQLIFAYLQPQLKEEKINRMDITEENKFMGCYQSATVMMQGPPPGSVELKRDSAQNLVAIFSELPKKQIVLKPTSIAHVYVDDSNDFNATNSGETRYALLINDKGERVIQRLSFQHGGYVMTECGKKK